MQQNKFFFLLLSCNFISFDHIQAADQIKKLYNLFLKIDATQVEVNPFGETPEGQGKKKREKRKQMNVIVYASYKLYKKLQQQLCINFFQ